jgi:hypothetical protein
MMVEMASKASLVRAAQAGRAVGMVFPRERLNSATSSFNINSRVV